MGAIANIGQQMRIKDHSALAIGTGLIALDIVESDSFVFRSAGGSCGNVMTMLAWLGWDALPVGRIGGDVCGTIQLARSISFEMLIRSS